MAITSSSTVPNDPAAVSANRAGQLTTWQRQILKPPSVLASQVAVVASLAVMVLGAYFFLVVPLSGLLRNTGTSVASLASPSYWTNNFVEAGIFPVLFLGFECLILWYLLIPSSRRLQAKLRLRRDLAEVSIAQNDGHVAFTTKRGYVARTVGGATLRSLEGGVGVNLAPGAYHLYYLSRSRRLLSADPQQLQPQQFQPQQLQPQFEPIGSQSGLLAALAKANRFSLNELEQNRQGRLSARQRLVAVRRVFWMLVIVVGLVVVAGISATKQAPLVVVVIVGVALFFLSIMFRASQDLLAGRVATMEGLVSRDMDVTDAPPPTYYYKLQNRKFLVSREGYNALVTGQQYRVYYLPRSKRLASIEPLP